MSARSFHNGKVQLHAGDCMEVLRELPDNSIDAVCTDPPYHLVQMTKRYGQANAKPCGAGKDGSFRRLTKGFMGKVWDGGDIAFTPELWAEVLRVLKPGGHMVCFGGTRTYHRMACAIEDAGFEIRDQLAWTYGSGFPKSHDVSKGIDKAAGAEREVVGSERNFGATQLGDGKTTLGDYAGEWDITAPATDAARQWQGWGTALKPAWEPICLARKPLSESTVAANVLRWGTGAINVDRCRIESGEFLGRNNAAHSDGTSYVVQREASFIDNSTGKGRFPANLIHDGSPEVLAGFPENTSKGNWTGKQNGAAIWGGGRNGYKGDYHEPDSGSAARFFYTAKADADDRLGSKHPTVKPVDLMQWLVRLVCPKGGTVLDLFAGTGTTGAAAFIEGCRAVLIEREAEYLADIERRMDLVLSGPDERARKLAKAEPYESLPLFGVA